MDCDDRYELRLPKAEKRELIQHAKAKGIPASEIVRRGIRIATGQKEPPNNAQTVELVALRRLINKIDARLGPGDCNGVAADLARAKAGVQSLLGR